MSKNLYHMEEGYFLTKSDPDYEAYSSVYDKKQGYYDADQYESFDLDRLKSLAEQVTGCGNYYVIITNLGEYDETDEALAPDENGFIPLDDLTGVDYNSEDIVYYKAVKNGKPVIIENAPVQNSVSK